jgi:hypothetical protein
LKLAEIQEKTGIKNAKSLHLSNCLAYLFLALQSRLSNKQDSFLKLAENQENPESRKGFVLLKMLKVFIYPTV